MESKMNDLIQQMKVVLATTFSMYLKTHSFHWNVEGPHFNDYHKMLGDTYADLWEAVDVIAEQIRTLDAYAPGSLSRFSQLSKIDDQINVPNAKSMLKELLSDNTIMIAELNKAFKLAEQVNKQGLLDFLAGRLDAHEKLGWFLRSMTKE
jgi:starvation-inducible DNA-binding protein